MIEAGFELGNYRIIRKLGAGGMADVYEAEDTRLGRHLALKLLPLEMSRSGDLIARFEKEIQAAAALNHPNIVTLFEFGHQDSYHFYTMQILPGGDLRDKIRKSMDVRQVFMVMRGVASAFVHAHSRGFVHRDVKPENILFDEHGTPVLTDFGIAKAMDSQTRMTMTGMAIGTPRYISPEQARGRPIDGRADLYSLGCIFYEMLAGKPPYDANDAFALVFQHISDPIPTLPAEHSSLQPLLDSLMAKEKEDRCADANTLLAEIDRLFPRDWTGSIAGVSTVSQPIPGAQSRTILPTKPLFPKASTESALESAEAFDTELLEKTELFDADATRLDLSPKPPPIAPPIVPSSVTPEPKTPSADDGNDGFDKTQILSTKDKAKLQAKGRKPTTRVAPVVESVPSTPPVAKAQTSEVESKPKSVATKQLPIKIALVVLFVGVVGGAWWYLNQLGGPIETAAPAPENTNSQPIAVAPEQEPPKPAAAAIEPAQDEQRLKAQRQAQLEAAQLKAKREADEQAAAAKAERDKQERRVEQVKQEQAAQQSAKLAKQRESDAQTLLQQGATHMKTKDWSSAKQSYQRVVSDYADTSALAAAKSALLQIDQRIEQSEADKKSQVQSQSQAQSQAQAQEQSRQREAAAEALKRDIARQQREKRDQQRRAAAQKLLDRGDALRAAKDADAAIKQYQLIVKDYSETSVATTAKQRISQLQAEMLQQQEQQARAKQQAEADAKAEAERKKKANRPPPMIGF